MYIVFLNIIYSFDTYINLNLQVHAHDYEHAVTEIHVVHICILIKFQC